MRRPFRSPVTFCNVIENGWTDAPIEMWVKTGADSILQKFEYVPNDHRNEIWNGTYVLQTHTQTKWIRTSGMVLDDV